jgi:signal transduction histidine kinase/CheY-like chemotaxis protein
MAPDPHDFPAAALDAILRHLPGVVVALVDREMCYVYAGGAVLGELGLSGRAVAGLPAGSISGRTALDAATAERGYRAALAGERSSAELHLGGRVFTEQFVPIEGPDGITGALALAHDVTEARAAELRLRAVLAQLPGIRVTFVDEALVIRAAGGGGFADAGVDADALVGRTVTEAAGGIWSGDPEESYRAVLAGEPREFAYEHGGRSTRVSMLPAHDERDRPAVLTVSRDTTAERAQLAALDADRARLEAAIGQIDGMIFTQDAELRYTWAVNSLPLFPDPAAVVGRTDRQLLGDAEGAALEALKRRVLAGETVRQDVASALGGAPSVYEVLYRPQRGADGAVIGLVGVARDATARRREEREAAERSRAEALALLAGGAAHDLGNILAALTANLALVRFEVGDAHPASAAIGRAESSITSAAALTRQLLAYAGQASLLRGPVDLREVAREVAELVAPVVPAGVSLRLALSSVPVRVEGDRTALIQVALNLVRNALDALAATGGTALLRVDRAHTVPLGDWEVAGEAPPGAAVLLEVADDGPGIAAAVRGRIFVPFISTKAAGRGLGLAASAGIARDHQGALAARSDGSGTIVRLLLPAADAEPERRRLLYVEDDEAVRTATTALLERLGWAVTPVGDAAAGLAALRSDPDAYAVLLSDLELPGGGESLIAAARQIRGDLPVVVTSAWTGRLAEAAAALRGVRALPKPARPEEITAVLEAALGDPMGSAERARRRRVRRAAG